MGVMHVPFSVHLEQGTKPFTKKCCVPQSGGAKVIIDPYADEEQTPVLIQLGNGQTIPIGVGISVPGD
jgi:hypothetical protein